MATRPGLLLLVMDILRKAKDGEAELSGYDFSQILGDPVPDTPIQLYRISVDGVRPIERPNLRHIHQFSVGWRWVTSVPEQSPTPPFLLSDDPSYRLIYQGAVSIFPTGDMATLVRGECHHQGKFDIPVVSSNWFGGIRVIDPDIAHAYLWAFANTDLHLRGKFDHLVMADEGEIFGSIELPSDQTYQSKANESARG